MRTSSYHYVSLNFIIMQKVVNLNSQEAYTALGYAAGKFKVHVESSQVHTRLAMFKKRCAPYAKGKHVTIWYIRCKDTNQKNKLLILEVGVSLHQAILTNPEDVTLLPVNEVTISGQKYKLNKQEKSAKYELINE